MIDYTQLLKQVENLKGDAQVEAIKKGLGMEFYFNNFYTYPCSVTFSVTFCYCTASDLDLQLFVFGLLLNLLGSHFGFCYNPKPPVSLDSACSCCGKIAVMHFTLTRDACRHPEIA